MRQSISITIILVVIFSLTLVTPASASASQSHIPTFSIVSVVRGQSVTIHTYNFPNHDCFDVLMGNMGTRGVHGIHVDSICTGSHSSFTDTYLIPNSLEDNHQIAIRLQSNTGSGYFAYNWFYNNTTKSGTGGGGVPPKKGYSGFPFFFISDVTRNQTVTIRVQNLPPNDKFVARMGPMGTRGVHGYSVGTFTTGGGGTRTLTFDIPNQLRNSTKIAIRIESVKGSGYFAYNWFWNNTTH